MTATTLHGDCTELLPMLPPARVQCIVTSPPYFGLRDYGITPTAWPAIEYVPMAGLPPITIPPMTCCLGLEDSPLAYVGHLLHVFRLARPALRDDGVAWLNLGDSYAGSWGNYGGQNRGNGTQRTITTGSQIHNKAYEGTESTRPPTSNKIPGLKQKDLMMIPARVAMALQADGWWLRSQVIWQKPNAMPESVSDRPSLDYEPVFLLAKSARYYFDAAAIAEPAIKGAAGSAFHTGKTGVSGMGRVSDKERTESSTRNRRTVWRIATEALRAEHYAPMPQALVEPCILAGSRPGDTVLDMFAGSGTVLRVAERLQRDSIGMDLNADYIDLQHRRTNGVQVELFV